MRMLERCELFKPLLSSDMQAFDITPAAKWFLVENEREEYDIVDDFHRLVPPYPTMWMEFEHPSMIYSKQNGKTYVPPQSVGMVMETRELPDDFTQIAIPELAQGKNIQLDMLNYLVSTKSRSIDAACSHAKLLRKIATGERLRWFSVWTVFSTAKMFQRVTGEECSPVIQRAGFLNQHGRAMPDFLIGSAVANYLPTHEQQVEFTNAITNVVLPFAFALQLLHCKNVETTPIQVAPKVKMRRAKAGIPTVEYKMLSIAPLRKAIQGAGENQGAGSSVKRALHFVRGHFKDFSQGKGLFGKYQGLYWWHDQARGDAGKGVIDKDYRVKYE